MATSLFGGGMDEQAMQRQLINQRASEFAQLAPNQRLAQMGYSAGSALGGGLAKAMGVDVTDPTIKRASMLRSLASKYDTTTSEGLLQLAQELRTVDPDMAMKVAQAAQEMKLATAKTGVEEQKIAKGVLDVKQETALRDELAALGPSPTQEAVLAVVTKYGSPDKVLSALQASADRASTREGQAALQKERLEAQKQLAADKLEAQKQMAQDRIDAQIAAAEEAGATRLEIARMQNEGRQLIASMTAGLRQEAAADKKAEKLQKEETQKQGVVASFDSALETLNRIETHPGKATAVGFGGTTMSLIPGTSAAGFASQLETFKAQVFLPQVQALKGMGALSDAEGKKMTASIGALDQKMKPSEFNAQIAIIKADLEKAKARVLGKTKPTEPSTSAAAPVATKRWNPVTKKLESL